MLGKSERVVFFRSLLLEEKGPFYTYGQGDRSPKIFSTFSGLAGTGGLRLVDCAP